MLDLSVVIVNYNSGCFLQLCLDALSEALKGFDAEVIVIDNQSTDDSCQVVKQYCPWVNLIENVTNEGFGKANNRGIALAKGAYILLLNPDTIVQQDTLQTSINFLARSSQNGAVGVKMLDGSGCFLPESKRGLPRPKVAFYKAFGMAKLFPKSKRFARYYLGHLPSDEEAEVEVLAGAYMMCRAEVLRDCGGFDEDFFMYGEDIDLSYRISLKGYQLFYAPKAPIIHFKGESARRDATRAKHFYEAMFLFSEKHFAHQGWIWKTIINGGIRLRQMMSSETTVSPRKSDLSSLKLLVISSQEDVSPWQKVMLQFKSYVIQNPSAIDLSQGDAILFMPDVEKNILINFVQENAGKKQFFFAADNGNFILTSPSSLSQGEVFWVH